MPEQDNQKRFEIIPPDPEMIEVLHRVIDLNEQILRQNAEIIKELAARPTIIFDPTGKQSSTNH